VSLTDNIDGRSVISTDAIVRTHSIDLLQACWSAAKRAMKWFDNNGQANRHL
jgi:hypothetical protein